MHTPLATTVNITGVTFVAEPDLCRWVEEQSGAAYWLYTLELIAATIRPAINDNVRQVELYGVPSTERLYAKPLVDGEFPAQQEWTLQFARGVALLSRPR